jgi:hypothetical protein
MRPTEELFLAQAKQLADDCRPLFAGKPPAVLGVALAELVAEFFASMRPDRRGEALDDFRRAVDEMVPKAEKLIFPGGLPPEWRQ